MALVAAYGSSDEEYDAEELATVASPTDAAEGVASASAAASDAEAPDESGGAPRASPALRTSLLLPPPTAASGSNATEGALEDFVKSKNYGGDERADASRPPPGRGPLRLPAPKSRGTERQTVRISVPALSSYDSDEDDGPAAKKPKAATSAGSGLLSLLPKPKNFSVKDLIPQSLTRATAAAASSAQHRAAARQAGGAAKPPANAAASASGSSKQLLAPTAQAQRAAALAAQANQKDDDEGGDGGSANFFSLDSSSVPVRSGGFGTAPPATAAPPWALPSGAASTLDPLASRARETGSQSVEAYNSCEPSASSGDYPSMEYSSDDKATSETCDYGDDSYASSSASSSLFVDEQFLRMQGKRQRGKEDVQIVDVCEDDFRASQLELTKSLSQEVDPRSYSHRKKGEGPSTVEKRKHQITYLAYQAKERELELKNAWAASRATRQQTQSKYGF